MAFTSRAQSHLERKLVWQFGSPRSGSTWLAQLLRGAPSVVGIHEPLIGAHLGVLVSAVTNVPPANTEDRPRLLDLRDDEEYFFASTHKAAWAPALRQLILVRLASHVPGTARRCIVQEPNGSEGADVILAALPSSRVLFLARDGRDVVDSMLDAARPGTWLDEAFGLGQERAGDARLGYVIDQAYRWRFRTEAVQRAFEQHAEGLRYRVKYEDLLRDTVGEVTRIYDWLEIEAPRNVGEHVATLALASIPEAERGPGQFVRAATPGLWRTNLSPAEQAACDDIMGPLLSMLGYERSTVGTEKA